MAVGPITRRMDEDIIKRAENGSEDDKINKVVHAILRWNGMKPQEPKHGEWLEDSQRREDSVNKRETGKKEGE